MTSPTSLPKRTKALIVLLLFVLAMTAFYKWGRSLWFPVYAKARGKRTVKSVLKRFVPVIRKRFPNWRALTNGQPIALLAFKKERKIELWKRKQGRYRYVKTYRFTGFSGETGPKLKQGDGQIPEGLYRISYLNPNSSYHLSMKVNYPNRFDRKMARKDRRRRLGGDIFIHGNVVTIGCIPIGDKPIEELFTIIAANGYSRTKVIIAPHDFRRDPRFPSVRSVQWEATLYRHIKRALKAFTIPRRQPK